MAIQNFFYFNFWYGDVTVINCINVKSMLYNIYLYTCFAEIVDLLGITFFYMHLIYNNIGLLTVDNNIYKCFMYNILYIGYTKIR